MSKKVILIADDIEDVRQAIMRTLGEDNFVFLEASSGEAAIDLVKSQRVDLILSDIAMPKGNGIELLEKLRTIKNPPKVILVTGYASMFSGSPSGIKPSAIIEKPYRASDLIHLVDETLK
ncbi:MAG: response regulator [Bdellovibrionota bacterium]|nr:response regulator [Bdellovibrionota bacterium]